MLIISDSHGNIVFNQRQIFYKGQFRPVNLNYFRWLRKYYYNGNGYGFQNGFDLFCYFAIKYDTPGIPLPLRYIMRSGGKETN
jgi:hypothetical protein